MTKITNIFNFLKEFNELSNPVITEIDNQIKSFNISDIPDIEEIKSVFIGHKMDEMDCIEVIRPTILPCPKPTDNLVEWIQNDWKNLSLANIVFSEKLTRRESRDDDDQVVLYDEFFDEDQARVAAWNKWIELRNNWRQTEVPKSQGLDFYNELFQLYSDMKKEAESIELILADGNVRWNTTERIIDHPILLQKVHLQFDAQVPSFKIHCEEIKSELYTPLLRIIPSVNQLMLSNVIDEVEKGDFSLVTSRSTNNDALFKRIITIIDKKGIFAEVQEPLSQTATIYSKPVLFLRKRTLGFSNFIEGVIDDFQQNPGTKLPKFFEIMTGVYHDNIPNEFIEKSWNYSGIDKDVLLTLPANDEQLRIIKNLDKYGSVLVQGPPGTGKTHTIANLVGHLLSQGNSVLVTSHTEKALSVLKEKVYKDPHDSDLNLQNLCISLLSSTSQKKEMDSAINEISAKSSAIDLNVSIEKIKQQEKERSEMVDQLEKITKDLVRARSNEYKDLIFDNHSISPIEAAKFLQSGEGIYDYIVGESNNNEIILPITKEELNFLYSSNDLIDLQEEYLLIGKYPTSDQIMSVSDFTHMVDQKNTLQHTLDDNPILNEADIKVTLETVKVFLDESNVLISNINRFEDFEISIVNMTIVDPTYPNLWNGVIEKTESLLSKYESYRLLKLHDDFDIDESKVNKQTLKTIQEIIDSGKEKPVWLFAKNEWKRLKGSIKVNGRSIESRQEYIKVHELLSYETEKIDVFNQVKKLLVGIIDVEKLSLVDFENKVRLYHERTIEALYWYHREFKIFFEKINGSVQWRTENKLPQISSILNIDEILNYLQLTGKLLQGKINKNELHNIDSNITDYKVLIEEYTDENPIIEALFEAVNLLNKDKYAQSFCSLSKLLEKNTIAAKRRNLFARIGDVAPILASLIEKREGIHSNSVIPEHFYDAWKHFQLRNQLEKLDALNPEIIQERIKNVNEQLMKNARELALEKAWYEKVKNQTDKQNQALQGWRSTVKQIGKGTGKNAPMLKRKAKELMADCRDAIPVWIMPLSRVFENFKPGDKKFDVIIIDEASQADILAIAALYLAKKVIIVGDDEQVSPNSTVGVKSEEVNALAAQHLERIPNNHLFNGSTSLYDMAKSSGFKTLMLTEHFRCLPEIIGFSNELSYGGMIKPLRDASNTSVYPPLVEYRVPGASRNKKKVNQIEVDHIVSLIQAFLEIDEYKNQTIGVISMVGDEQSTSINQKLQSVIDPVVYDERRIQCGTPAQFQGDERDIIILSLVDTPNEKGGPIRLLSEDGNNDKNRKRYNVAVSRARNQLWVVHSLNPEIDLKAEDIRLKLINYAINPSREHDGLLQMSESPFETEVMGYLLSENYKVIPQYKVGAYRIDMVIQYEDKRVALECDGERYHTDLEQDLARQAILERLGWRFVRIRGSAYYRNKEQTMRDVVGYLNKYGIHPTYENSSSNSNENDTLINKVKIKANAIRSGLQEISTDVNLKGIQHTDGTIENVAQEIKSIEANNEDKTEKNFSIPNNVNFKKNQISRVTKTNGSDIYETTNYIYKIDNEKVTILEYTGSETTVRIPSEILGNRVVKIGRAFPGCTSLKHVSIPSSVTIIGNAAFIKCTKLEKLEIESGVEEIRMHAFSGCTALKSISIPDTVLKIGNHAFSECTALKNVSIPSNVREIGKNAFSRCTGLENVGIEHGVETIRANAFSECTSLKSISIPSTVREIDENAIRRELLLERSIGVNLKGIQHTDGTIENVAQEIKNIEANNVDKTDIASFTKNLKKLRESRGLSQLQLSQKLSLKITTVKSYESGFALPAEKIIKKICDVLEVSTSDLFRTATLEDSKEIHSETNFVSHKNTTQNSESYHSKGNEKLISAKEKREVSEDETSFEKNWKNLHESKEFTQGELSRMVGQTVKKYENGFLTITEDGGIKSDEPSKLGPIGERGKPRFDFRKNLGKEKKIDKNDKNDKNPYTSFETNLVHQNVKKKSKVNWNRVNNYGKLIILVDEGGEEHDFILEKENNKHLLKDIEDLLIYVLVGDTIEFKGYNYIVKSIKDLN